MSKKGLKTMLVCIVLLIGLVTLFACNKSNVADKDGQTKVIVKIQDEDGSIYKENVVFSDLFTLSLQKEGYTGRLYRDADFLKPLTKDSKVKNGDTVYVKWTINKYTVTFMDGEKVLATFTNVTHGDTVTAPEVPEKDGKTFSKWDKDFSKVTSDLTINAVYDVDTFTVTFKDGEKLLETQTVEYEAAATAPDTARLSPPEGMHFAKWDKDFSKVTEDIEVSAVYELNEYTVTFKNGETTITTKKVKHGFAATAPNVYDTATKKFVGWDKSFDNVTSDIIVNAKWETKKFTLTFINFDGTSVYTEEVEYGASIDSHFETADSAATYDDTILDYVGWYDNSDTEKTIIDDFSELTMPTRDLTYVLKLRLMDSAIGDFKVNTPADFTFTESNTAEFTVTPNEGTKLHKGVTYKYIWTINKDNVIYKTEETTESSLTLQNLAAGKYMANVKIVASMENCGSVEKGFTADKTLIVSRADISDITVTGVEMTYGDKTKKIGISGLREGDVITYKEEREEEFKENVDLSALDCGEYGYYVRISRGDNYNPYTSGKITVKIDKAEVTATVTPDNATLTYGNTLPSLTATINGETYTIESGKYELHLGMTAITGNVANNVGTYNIENVDISVLREKYPEKNYNITVETVGTITINKANLAVTVTSDKTELTYGEALPIISHTISGLKLSDTVTITETKFAEKLDAGTYTATAKVSGEKTKFYEITVNTVDFKVNKKPATITINAVNDIIYGDEVPGLSAKVEGVLDGDSLSYTLETNYTVGAGKGEYTASVVFNAEAAENKNYAIAANGTTFNVVQKPLTIKLNNTATVAVGKTYKVEAEHLEKIGLVAGDTVTGYVTITKDVKGTYYADDFDKSNLVVTNADCYVISYEMSVTFVEVTFAIDFADVMLTYDGQPHGVSVTKTDDSKNYTITYGTTENDCTLNSSPAYKNAGTYTIYFKVVDTANGAEEKGSVTLTINKKAVEIKVNDVTITYGDTPEFSYEATGLLNGDTLSGDADYSGAGTDAGVYDISVSGLTASDNYAVTVKTGTLTINKKTAKADWTIAENYVYSPDGQTLPTATYDGKTANLIFTKDGKACEFKNAGTYTVTIKEDKNYTLSGETTKTIVIEKATYTSVTAHEALSGIYDPNKTLGNYTLSEGFTWVNPDEVPVCTKTVYEAKYNKDPENYDYLDTTVTLVLQKATVTLAENLFEFDYDGASHEISTTVKYNNIEVTEPYTLTFEKNMFSDAGTHRTLVTMQADNYDLPKNTYVYAKVKGVKVGNNYYTIEDALFNSKSGDTVEFISAAKEVSFAPLDIATAIYADNAYRTVKAGVTLKLASDEDSSATIGKPTYGNGVGNYVDTDSSKIKQKLILNESTVLEVYGNILIQGLLGVNGQGLSGHTSGNHSQIINNGTINLNSGTNLDLRGYIKGAGTIEARSGAIVYSPFVIYDYRGGTNTVTVYRKGNIAPFRIYEMPNIQCNYSILYGAEHKGYLDLYASNQHRTDIATIIGNSNAMLIMEDSSSHIIKTYTKIDNGIGMTNLTITGKAKMGTLEITVSGVTVSMTDVRFPMPWNYSINVGDGLNPTTFTLPYDYKMMTGATVNVKKSATVNLTGTLLIYKSFTDTPFPVGGIVYPNKGEAKLNVEGVVNAIGGIAGEVHGINGGKVIIGNTAILSITEKEGNSGSTKSWQALIGAGEFVTVATISEVAKVVNADNSTVAAVTNKTYNYNNGTWQ